MEQGRGNAVTARLAVIGCGQWGRNLIRNFHALGALAAVSDVDEERTRSFAEQYAVSVLGPDRVLDAPNVDGVVIASPAETHGDLVIRALEAGKHVFVEKPLALEVAKAEHIRSKAEATGRIVMVGHLLQYHPAFLELKKLVAEGRLGRLQYIYSNRLNLGRIRRKESVFWSFAPHDISMILSLAGNLPERVEATGHNYLHASVSDVTMTNLCFSSGLNAHVFVSWLHPFKEQRFVVVADGGMAVFDDGQPWSHKLLVYPHSVTWRSGLPEPRKAEAELIVVKQGEPLALECAHFLDCMRSGQRPRTDAEEGLRVLRVLDAAQQSMTTRQATGIEREPARAYFVHASACVDDGCEIGAGSRIWHYSHILAGSKIGRDCVVGQNVMIGPDVSIGDRCKIQNNVSLYKGVMLGDGVFCGPSCVFTNVRNPRAEMERKNEFLPTPVGRGATIGANATIICGNTLEEYCFVAAGAVVTRDVAAHALVAGNPARQIGWVSHAGERLEPDLVCPRTGRRYAPAEGGRLVEIVSEEQVAKPIAFIDLAAQQARVRSDIEGRISGVLAHGGYIMGPEVAQLEQELAMFCGARHAITCANGTEALALALMAKGLKLGEAVIVPSFTFCATAEAVCLLGGVPLFVDVLEDTFNLDPASLVDAIDYAKRLGLPLRGVITVDLFGQPCDYDIIEPVVRENRLFLICDAAQAFGAEYNGRKVGTLGDITTTSFFPAKPFGCYGDGGAIFTEDDCVAEVVRSLRLHGQGRDKYDNVRIGLNSRLDTLQAAILLAKLRIFPQEITLRHQVAERYALSLAGLIRVPPMPERVSSVWAQYTVRLPERDRLVAELKQKGVPTAVYYGRPLHQQTAYRHFPRVESKLLTTERLAAEVVSLPMHPWLSQRGQDCIVSALREALEGT